MTNEEKQQIKARFFGAHIGCMVKIGDFVEILDGVYYPDTIKVQSSKLGHWPISNCKLILRSLSSITDEEAIEYAVIMDGSEADLSPASVSSVKAYLKRSNKFQGGDLIKYDYLRSKNFALPFFGYDPIQEGWAVLESDKNSPKI
jgi:hypothetical protein